MKRTLGILSLLGLAAVWASLAYQGVTARERDYRTLLRTGDAAMLEDQTFAAVEAYSNAIYLRPDSMLAHLRRGETYQRRGDLVAAARDFRSAANLDPSATRPLEELGDVHYAQQYFRRAAETYEARLRLDDRSQAVNRKLALARYRDGNIDGAVTALEQTAKLGALLTDDYYLLGICLREKGQLKTAVDAFEKAVALSPGSIPAREELADLYAAAGRQADHLDQLQTLAGLDPQRAERKTALALAHAAAGQIDLAVEILRNTLESAPDRTHIYGAIGRVWLDVARLRTDRAALSKALEALERGATTAAATSEIMVLYGRALALDGQAEAAERVLLNATQRFPVDPSAFSEYAAIAERRGHLGDARAALIHYGALVSGDHELARRAQRLGALALRMNDPQAALIWLERAAETLSDDPALLAALADAQLRSGDPATARTTALRGLAKEPTSVALRTVELRTRP